MQFTVYISQYAAHNMQFTVYSSQCKVYSAQCILQSVQLTISTLRYKCTVYFFFFFKINGRKCQLPCDYATEKQHSVSHSPWHNNQPKQGYQVAWYIINNSNQAKSSAVYLSGGCQVSSLVIRGRLDFWYLWVRQVTGFSEAVGFHLVLVFVTCNCFVLTPVNNSILLVNRPDAASSLIKVTN